MCGSLVSIRLANPEKSFEVMGSKVKEEDGEWIEDCSGEDAGLLGG